MHRRKIGGAAYRKGAIKLGFLVNPLHTSFPNHVNVIIVTGFGRNDKTAAAKRVRRPTPWASPRADVDLNGRMITSLRSVLRIDPDY
uniref:30S ribosomal protein S5 n=1 Tax=Ascaris lumbricoides TaxID=6252 RepID=A0A0M3I676_ASCLU